MQLLEIKVGDDARCLAKAAHARRTLQDQGWSNCSPRPTEGARCRRLAGWLAVPRIADPCRTLSRSCAPCHPCRAGRTHFFALRRDRMPLHGSLTYRATKQAASHLKLRAGGQGRCRLVVFGMEVGGRFSLNALVFIRRLARARGRARVPWNAAAAGRAFTWRWHCLASLAALRAHAQTLRELPVQSCDAGDDQELPLGELLAERPGQPDCEP